MWRHLVWWGVAVTVALVAHVPVSTAQDPPVQNSGSAYTGPYPYPGALLAYKDKIFSGAGKFAAGARPLLARIGGRHLFPILTLSATTLHPSTLPGHGPLAGDRRDIGVDPDQVTISAFDATTMASVGPNISYTALLSSGIYGAAADLVNGFGYFIPYTSVLSTQVPHLT